MTYDPAVLDQQLHLALKKLMSEWAVDDLEARAILKKYIAQRMDQITISKPVERLPAPPAPRPAIIRTGGF